MCVSEVAAHWAGSRQHHAYPRQQNSVTWPRGDVAVEDVDCLAMSDAAERRLARVSMRRQRAEPEGGRIGPGRAAGLAGWYGDDGGGDDAARALRSDGGQGLAEVEGYAGNKDG